VSTALILSGMKSIEIVVTNERMAINF